MTDMEWRTPCRSFRFALSPHHGILRLLLFCLLPHILVASFRPHILMASFLTFWWLPSSHFGGFLPHILVASFLTFQLILHFCVSA